MSRPGGGGVSTFDVSERLACRGLRLHRFTQRQTPKGRPDDAALTADVIDGFARECLCIPIGRRRRSLDVIDVLPALFIQRGLPGHIRSDSGAEFAARAGRN